MLMLLWALARHRPGGDLSVGEGELEGLQRVLASQLLSGTADAAKIRPHELLSTWWRPMFDRQLVRPAAALLRRPFAAQ